jgi:hypothetical protein
MPKSTALAQRRAAPSLAGPSVARLADITMEVQRTATRDVVALAPVATFFDAATTGKCFR